MLFAAHGGLVYADAQAAVARREGRRHDLLDPDHVAEEPKVVHPPRELAAAQGKTCSRLKQTGRQQQQLPHELIHACCCGMPDWTELQVRAETYHPADIRALM